MIIILKQIEKEIRRLEFRKDYLKKVSGVTQEQIHSLAVLAEELRVLRGMYILHQDIFGSKV